MLKTGYYVAGAAWAAVNARRPVGRNIYTDDWDICIVLDSARADDLGALAPSGWPRERAWSAGSITTEWLTNTFRRRYSGEIANTTLVTASPHSQTVFRERSWLTNQDSVAVPYPSNPAVEPADFREMYELWRSHATQHGVVPPETMRDATIEAYNRHGSCVVAHWMQPHEPFIAPAAEIVGGDALDTNVWDGLNSGTLDAKAVRESYRANLTYALEYVLDVLDSVDATVLVTADHGNAFGEWGIYGHPFGWPQPAVRKVPWITLEAERRRPVESPPVLGDRTPAEASIDEQLRALGYR